MEKCLDYYSEINDRFSFDLLFRRLLAEGYEHEIAKDIIAYNCFLGILVWQERIHNKFYLEIAESDKIAWLYSSTYGLVELLEQNLNA